jgi:hypothetical protein
MKLEYHDDLPRNIIDKLWEQNVNCDDWDYMIFLMSDREPDHKFTENLLHGCCDNVWYKVTDFFGKAGMLGVAYHA